MSITDIFSHGGHENKVDAIIQWLVDNDETEAAEVLRYLKFQAEDNKIVKRIWSIVDLSYDDLNGRSIYEVVEEFKADAKRYRYLKEHCSSHYSMTWEQPAEWSIGWEFQQSTPAEAYGSFDKWIDQDIEARAKRQAEIDAEEALSTLPEIDAEMGEGR